MLIKFKCTHIELNVYWSICFNINLKKSTIVNDRNTYFYRKVESVIWNNFPTHYENILTIRQIKKWCNYYNVLLLRKYSRLIMYFFQNIVFPGLDYVVSQKHHFTEIQYKKKYPI